jgi:hypothetical protein
VSRRRFIGTAAVATSLAVGSEVWVPLLAQAAPKQDGDPKPIPGTTLLGPFATPSGPQSVRLHFNPGVTNQTKEVLLVGDFNGHIGVARNTGAGTATNPDGSTTRLVFSTDVRVQKGVYRDVNGRVNRATWCFL